MLRAYIALLTATATQALPEMANQLSCTYEMFDTENGERTGTSTKATAYWDTPGLRSFEYQNMDSEEYPFEVYQVSTSKCMYSIWKEDSGKFQCDAMPPTDDIYIPMVMEGAKLAEQFNAEDGTKMELWSDTTDPEFTTNYTLVDTGKGYFIQKIEGTHWQQIFDNIKVGPIPDEIFDLREEWGCDPECKHEMTGMPDDYNIEEEMQMYGEQSGTEYPPPPDGTQYEGDGEFQDI